VGLEKFHNGNTTICVWHALLAIITVHNML